jgi:undecaprenyl diphosphate synthase
MGPRHIAIIMDGNGRWAKNRHLPRTLGHVKGAKVVRPLVKACTERGITHLTLFAFSTENWRRPPEEVSTLMGLFGQYLEKEVSDMQKQGVRFRLIGDRSAFAQGLQDLIAHAELSTAHNQGIHLTVAANYGGQWDILNATREWQRANPLKGLELLDAPGLAPYLSMAGSPDPDLLIRTGGESRISNFLLWQCAYTELYFTDALWPDFDAQMLDEALGWYQKRVRRFGRTDEQVVGDKSPSNPTFAATPSAAQAQNRR